MLPGTMDCITGAGGRGGGAGGGGGAGVAAGGGGGAGGGASIIFSAHAVSINTKERLANFALVVSFVICVMDLRYAQGAWCVGDALPREMSPLKYATRTKMFPMEQNYGKPFTVSRATMQDRRHRRAKARVCSLRPVMSIDQICEPPPVPAALVCNVRVNIMHAAIGRPGRTLVLPAMGDDALARTVGPHDADAKSPPFCLVKAIRSPRGLHTGVPFLPPPKLMRCTFEPSAFIT